MGRSSATSSTKAPRSEVGSKHVREGLPNFEVGHQVRGGAVEVSERDRPNCVRHSRGRGPPRVRPSPSPCLVAHSTKLGQASANSVRQRGPNSRQVRPCSGRVRPNASWARPKLGRGRPELGHNQPKFGWCRLTYQRVRPILGGLGTIWGGEAGSTDFGAGSTQFGLVRPHWQWVRPNSVRCRLSDVVEGWSNPHSSMREHRTSRYRWPSATR